MITLIKAKTKSITRSSNKFTKWWRLWRILICLRRIWIRTKRLTMIWGLTSSRLLKTFKKSSNNHTLHRKKPLSTPQYKFQTPARPRQNLNLPKQGSRTLSHLWTDYLTKIKIMETILRIYSSRLTLETPLTQLVSRANWTISCPTVTRKNNKMFQLINWTQLSHLLSKVLTLRDLNWISMSLI